MPLFKHYTKINEQQPQQSQYQETKQIFHDSLRPILQQPQVIPGTSLFNQQKTLSNIDRVSYENKDESKTDVKDNIQPYGALQQVRDPIIFLDEGIIDNTRDAFVMESPADDSDPVKFMNYYAKPKAEDFDVIWQPVPNADGSPSVSSPNFEVAPALLIVEAPPFLSIPVKNIPIYASRPLKKT